VPVSVAERRRPMLTAAGLLLHVPRGYKLHIEPTSRIDWPAMHRLAEATPLRDMVKDAEHWCASYLSGTELSPRGRSYDTPPSPQTRFGSCETRTRSGPIVAPSLGM